MKEGFWLDARTGRFWVVCDHAYFVAENGREMGLSDRAIGRISRLDPQADRVRILKIAMKAGFIRIRGHGVTVTAEFTLPLRVCRRPIIRFCRNIGVGGQAIIRLLKLQPDSVVEKLRRIPI